MVLKLDEVVRRVGTQALPTRQINVGERIRGYRKHAKLTLQEASDRTGVATSTFSKIERGELSPTLGTLQRISAGLQFDLASLLSAQRPAEGAARRTLTRSGEGEPYLTRACVHSCLCGELAGKRMLPFRARVVARSPEDYGEWAHHPGEIFVYILSGVLVFYSEFYEPVKFAAGDSFYYDGAMGHAWTTEGEEDAEVIWVHAS
jgi:transcriptional regulator with XRE-family HTH domain